jgi:hypothetical protein
MHFTLSESIFSKDDFREMRDYWVHFRLVGAACCLKVI